MHKEKNAFSLAEVLITLGIIGIVAAMILPTLVQNYQNKILSEQLKKGYSVISQAFTLMYIDMGEKLNPQSYPSKTFAENFKKYLSTSAYSSSSGITGIDEEDYYKSKVYKNYNNTSEIDASLLDEGQMIISDGMVIFIQNSPVVAAGILITIDINGIKKRPNRWGHDLFTFRIDEKGKLIPSELPDSNYLYGNKNKYCSIISTAKQNGLACTYYAVNNICPYDNKKSYWKCLPK